MDKKEQVAKTIIENLGGKANINNAWHCMTRLRFDIKDESLIKEGAIKDIPEVVGAQNQNNQYQIIIGTDVDDYFQPLAKELGIDEDGTESDGKREKRGLVAMFMDIVSGVFGPIVPAIAGAGMIKGLIAGLVALKVISDQSPTVQVLDMLASGVFVFLPFFVAISAAKIFKTNQYLAVAIAASMQYPTMTAAVAAGNVKAFHLFGFIPIPVFNYAGTVIPIIFSVLVLSYVYRWVDRLLPRVLRTVFTPTFSLFIGGLIALVIIGPIGIYLGDGLAWIVQGLFKISPIVAGIVVGAIRPVAILTGLHHAMTPIALQNFANQGYDMLMPMMFMANMAITGATLAMYRKAKTQQEKSVIISSALSGLLGITEPALFGVLTKYKRALLAATIGSAVASAFISAFGVRIYGYILSSIFSLPAYIGKYFIFAVLGIIIAIAVSFVAGIFLVKKPADDENEKSEETELELAAVTTGEYIALEQVADQAFASKALGDGYAIKPDRNEVFAPVAGVISTIFPTKHAIGITTPSGVEVLVHMGIDTVSLAGKPFETLVQVGDKVGTKTQIASMDIAEVAFAGKDITIMVVITNMDKIKAMPKEQKATYTAGEEIGFIALS